MASDESGEKTEEATQQRREDFRKRGQVAQTKELATVLTLFAAVVGIWLVGRFFMEGLVELFTKTYGEYVATAVKDGNWLLIARYASVVAFKVTAPLFVLFALVSLAASLVQVGFLYNEEAMQFKLERLDPVQGLKKIFSIKSVVEGIKSILKMTLVCGVVYLLVRSEIFTIPHLQNFSIPQLISFVFWMILKILAAVGGLMLVLALADYLFQKYNLEKEMRMTKQEVKEEFKNREGDPLIKSKMRRIQREMATKRMMEDVPKADVIITNPTHISVAIKYDANMVAPTVIAKGADLIAAKIREIAKENKIPIVENKPLARAMYKTIKIGQSIPKELYTAVAEVLSYVYRLRRKKVN